MMVSVYADPSITIKTAASRARGDRLRKLRELCATQKTVSTRRLGHMVDELAQSDCQDAIHFKWLADFVQRHSQKQPEKTEEES